MVQERKCLQYFIIVEYLLSVNQMIYNQSKCYFTDWRVTIDRTSRIIHIKLSLDFTSLYTNTSATHPLEHLIKHHNNPVNIVKLTNVLNKFTKQNIFSSKHEEKIIFQFYSTIAFFSRFRSSLGHVK